jgi:flavin-dependent dehydrogenase
MSPETVRHLDGLGVLPALDAAGGTALAGTTVIGPRGSRLTGLFARADTPPFRPTGLSIPRRLLDAHLVDAARRAGAVVLEGHGVVELMHARGGVAGAVVRDEQGGHRPLRARLTIGADGLHSVVAQRLGTRRHGLPRRWAFVAHVADVTGLTDRAEMHVGSHGYVGLNPLGGGITNVALVVPRALVPAARGRVTAFFRGMLETFPGVRDRVGGRLVREVLVTGPFAAWSRRVSGNGVLLVGDAADFFDPFTGEGICAALRGGEFAACAGVSALERPGPVTADRLAGYRAARRRAFAGKWAVERLIGYGMAAPALFDRAVGRLEARGWSHTLVGVTGDFVPARAVLNPRFLTGMLW